MELVTLHLGTLLLTACVLLYADYEGYAYFRGWKAMFGKHHVVLLHRLVWIGLIAMITTGVMLAIPLWSFLQYEIAFYVKVGFVLVLVVNAFAIGRLSHVATVRPFSELSPHEQETLMISGVLSGIGWVGAAIIGFFFL